MTKDTRESLIGIVVTVAVILVIAVAIDSCAGPKQPWQPNRLNAVQEHFACRQLGENVYISRGRLEMFEQEKVEPDQMFRDIDETYRTLNGKWCKKENGDGRKKT
ncbi:MAG: hypothetical protein WC050_00695 [Candidatus Paceibacterota bacterium]